MAQTNVRVLGTTATQAAIAYTAPNGSPCSVAVSQTADGSGVPLVPLVHDIDTSIFAGSDQDSRTGNVGYRPGPNLCSGPADCPAGR